MSLLTSRISPVGQAGRVKRLHASGVVGIELSEGQPLQWPGRVVTPGRDVVAATYAAPAISCDSSWAALENESFNTSF